jgi:hypothetical protein
MRKIRIVGFGLFAALALCVFAAGPAFAEDEWLVGGAAFAEELPTETEGTEVVLMKYEAANSETVLTEILCSGVLDGTIYGKTLDKLTDVLNLEMGTIGTLVDNLKTALNCEVTFHGGGLTDCEVGSLASVWLVGISLELGDFVTTETLLNGAVTTGMFGLENNLNEPVGYDMECKSLLGVNGSEECTGAQQEVELTNDATTVPPSIMGTFISEKAKRVNCSMTGEHSAEFLGLGNLWAIGAELERLETALS